MKDIDQPFIVVKQTAERDKKHLQHKEKSLQ